MKTKSKTTIGTLDKIDLPSFGLYDIPCKIDTGANTSAIHCHSVKLVEKEGEQWLSFHLLDPTHSEYNNQKFWTQQFGETIVKSSFGQKVYRYVIRTEVVLFGETFSADFTLADRENMKYPILLGKKLLKNRFVVDVAKNNLSFKLKQKS